MESTIDRKRLELVMSWSLKVGMHYENLDGNGCLLEAVSYLAGETWNDRPRCVCPVIALFVDVWEQGIRDEDRDRLMKPLMVPLIDLAGATAVGELVRSADEATAAAEDAVVVSEETGRAWVAAWECGGDAWRFSGGDAAQEVAEQTLEAAAEAVAWEEASRAMKGAATVFAWSPALAAASAAPKDPSGNPAAFAAWDISVAALAPIVDSLLPSALDLVNRMIALRE